MVDAVVVGSGPNGLAAAIVLARAGLSVEVVEAARSAGGAVRSEPFGGMPSVRFDVGSAVHPFIGQSEFFRRWDASARVPYVTPEISFAHPLDDGRAVAAFRDLEATSVHLGKDARAWTQMFGALTENQSGTANLALNPAAWSAKHLGDLTRMARRVMDASWSRSGPFQGSDASALLSGVMAHSNAPIPSLAAASVGVVLATLAHGAGWPLPIGGAQSLVDEMVRDVVAHGGSITTGRRVETLDELWGAKIVMLDTSLVDAVEIAGGRWPSSYRRILERRRSGPGVFKLDFVTTEPIPWSAEIVKESPTVHLGGTWTEIQQAESQVQSGRHPDRPYVLLVQPTVADPKRSPGRTVVWAYCHVPSGSTVDMAEPMLGQIERFAPGFRDTISLQQPSDPHTLNAANANLMGGDIGGGSLKGLGFINRPHLGPRPWKTPTPGMYLCSSYVAPGPGVHGMGGLHAARLALHEIYGLPLPELGPQADHR